MREVREESRAKDVRDVGESGLPRQPAVAAIAALKREKYSEVESCQRGDDSSSIVVNLVLSLYNAMASPVDVGGLSNHVKYCVSVLSLQWANIRTSPVGIPYIEKFFYDKIHLKTMRPNASDGLEPKSLVGSMKFQIMPSSAWLQVGPTPR